MAATLTLVNSIPSTEADFLPPPPSFTVIHRGESTASKQAKTTNSNRTERQADSNSDCGSSSSTRKKRSSGDGQHSNLIVAVYSVCCLYQFVRYLPLLILRVCFGSMQQQQSASPNARRATKSKASSSNSNPSMKTLAGLLLLGLPLMLLSGLPIIGRLVASSPASPSSRASSRSRASSISSAASSSRAGCRSYSMSSASDS
uniref:Membrane-associated protein n=1 Tax=Macrostomum lignano TaxID=282301 RepID=A0A1I8G4I2_9PLAT